MLINPNSDKPLYVQIAESVENDILDEILLEEERAYSQYQVAESLNINPATAGKGIKLLEQEGILFKKRGLGMFVSQDAKEMILSKRKKVFVEEVVKDMLVKAQRLGLTKAELIEMIESKEV